MSVRLATCIRLSDLRKKWKAMATGITVHSDGERVQSSGSQQRMADAVGRYVDIENEVNAQIDKLVDLKKEVINTIEQLPAQEYDLLHKVYIQLMSFAAAAAAYNKHPKWAARIHGSALQKVQKIWCLPIILNIRSISTPFA